MTRAFLIASTLLTALAADIVSAQSPVFAACGNASPDSFAASPDSNMFAMPGVATDYVVAAGGQLVERGDGTARLSAFLHRRSQLDRRFLLEVELSGELLPGALNHPPLGTLPPQLLPAAYSPLGPVDPSTFRYYTSGSGSLRGFGAYAGAVVALQMSSPLQIGAGANDRNVLSGLAANFSVQVLSQPTFLTLNPTDEAQLRATTSSQAGQCATHADRDDNISAGPLRSALSLPGVGLDYVFIPAGEWTEASDGSATLTGTMRREDDFEDRWELSVSLQSRVDPGDGSYPPSEGPVLGLLSSAYVAAGGIIDPNSFRYYGTVSGTLTGGGNNDGGVIALTSSRPFQVGVGADQANAFFGVYGEFTASVTNNPTSHAVAVTGPGTLLANVSTACILPYPNQTPGLHIVLDNITGDHGVITGANLAWIEQMSIGSRLITSGNQRNWTRGYLKVISSSLVEVYPPQSLPPGTYTTRVFTRSLAGGFRQMTLNLPAAPAIATAPDRFIGEPQDWFISHGNLGAPALTVLVYSGSNLPSSFPGQLNLGIGNGFTDVNILTALITDAVTGAAVFHAPAIPATLQGGRLYFQAPMFDPATSAFPLLATNVTTTLYQ